MKIYPKFKIPLKSILMKKQKKYPYKKAIILTYTVNNYSPTIIPLYSIGKCFVFFVPAFEYKIYSQMLYHLHSKANACNIGTFIRFYMQSTLHSKANVCNIGNFIRFYIQMRVQKKQSICL